MWSARQSTDQPQAPNVNMKTTANTGNAPMTVPHIHTAIWLIKAAPLFPAWVAKHT